MASRRKLILDAVISRLREISIANGWPLDVTVQKALQTDNTRAGDPTASRNRVYVHWRSDPIDLRQNAARATRRLEVGIEIVPAPSADTNDVDELVDPLLTAVEKRMLQVAESEDPMFGVPGVVDVTLSSDLFPLDEEGLVGVGTSMVIEYEHDRSDPETYGGAGAEE